MCKLYRFGLCILLAEEWLRYSWLKNNTLVQFFLRSCLIMGNSSGRDQPHSSLRMRVFWKSSMFFCFAAGQKVMQNVESQLQESQSQVLIDWVKSYRQSNLPGILTKPKRLFKRNNMSSWWIIFVERKLISFYRGGAKWNPRVSKFIMLAIIRCNSNRDCETQMAVESLFKVVYKILYFS